MNPAHEEQLRRDYTEPGADHSCFDYYDHHIHHGRSMWFCTRCDRVLQTGSATPPSGERRVHTKP